MSVLRVQASDGRGPFRPGFTASWSDSAGVLRPPALVERAGWQGIVVMMRRSGLYCGAGCRSRASLRKWFTRAEERRLLRLGYRVVEVEPDMVFAEWPDEVLFGCTRPLAEVAQ